MSLAYQWERCDSTGGGCVDIPGATGTSYVLTSADLGHTLRVRETDTTSGGSASTVSGPTAVITTAGGVIVYEKTYEDGSLSSGSWVLSNVAGADDGYAYWGAMAPDNTQSDTGGWSMRVDVPQTYPLAPDGVQRVAAAFNNKVRNIDVGVHDYYAFAVKLPVGWQPTPYGSWGTLLLELNFENVAGGPLQFAATQVSAGVYASAVYLNSGPVTSGQAQYYSGSLPQMLSSALPPRNMPGPNPWYVQMAGNLTPGVWYEYVLHCFWTYGLDGVVECWWRQQGSAPWTQAFSHAEGTYPTLQTGAGFSGTVTTATTNFQTDDRVGVYCPANPHAYSIWHDNFCRANTFAAAASVFA